MAVSADKTRFQVTISNDLAAKIDAYCKEAGISRSAYLSLLAAKDLEDSERFLAEFKKEINDLVKRLNMDDESVPK